MLMFTGLPTTTQSPEQNFEELMMTNSHGMNWEDQTTLTTVVNWEWIFGENNIEGTGGTIKMLEMKQTTASSENGPEFGESTTWFGGEFGWNENGPEFEESTTWFEGGEFGWNEGIDHGSTTNGFGHVLFDLEPTAENGEIDPGLLALVTTTELSTKQTTHTCFRRKWMWRSTATIFKPTAYLLLVGWIIERIIFN